MKIITKDHILSFAVSCNVREHFVPAEKRYNGQPNQIFECFKHVKLQPEQCEKTEDS